MAQAKPTAYFRDKFVAFDEANLSIASASVLYGLSIYTVMPVFWEQKQHKLYLFRLKDHYKRLQNSCRIMEFRDFDAEFSYKKFKQTIEKLLEKNSVREDCLVRIAVFVDDSLKGTRMHGLKHSLSAFVYTTEPLLPKTGARLCVSSWRRTPDNAIPSRAKINGGYVNASLMKHEATLNGFDDAIALDMNDHVCEGTVANLFIVRDNLLITPSSSTDILEGITRDTVQKLSAELNLKSVERQVDRSELYVADEAFFTGSSVQITPIIEIDNRKIGDGKAGKVTKQLMKTYSGLISQPDKYTDWLSAVNMLK